ncbi:2OG-Fe(II) oxygenase [Flexithrix dorotheae]|uniref:2OG-Fe(II) oxygenase n=1 Tax=Flexithrix dorotheae TaxID=70993 RepID=UPI0003670EDB|nr:2OG-Fe(II) oxygenase [Flexithrix dorotheae]
METALQDDWVNRVDRLSNDNYLIVDDFLSEENLWGIKSYFKGMREENELQKAGIGTLSAHQFNSEIRGDSIFWLSKGENPFIDYFLQRMDELKENLNQLCFLSLSGYEFHLALYPRGSFYLKHLDQFKGRNNRLVSVILYLNENWMKGDGGELKMYLEDGEKLIEPIANRLVIFKSDLVEHEVLPTLKERYSLTGWMLYQPPGLGFLLG